MQKLFLLLFQSFLKKQLFDGQYLFLIFMNALSYS